MHVMHGAAARLLVQVVDVLGAEEQLAAALRERRLEPGQRRVGGVRPGGQQVAPTHVVERRAPRAGSRAKASGVASFIGSNRAQMPPASRKVPRPLSAETPAPVRTKTLMRRRPNQLRPHRLEPRPLGAGDRRERHLVDVDREHHGARLRQPQQGLPLDAHEPHLAGPGAWRSKSRSAGCAGRRGRRGSGSPASAAPRAGPRRTAAAPAAPRRRRRPRPAGGCARAACRSSPPASSSRESRARRRSAGAPPPRGPLQDHQVLLHQPAGGRGAAGRRATAAPRPAAASSRPRGR